MTNPRTPKKTLLSILGAVLALGLAMPAAAQTSPTTALRSAFDAYAHAEEARAAAVVGLERALIDHEAGRIDDRALQRARDRETLGRTERNELRRAYGAAWNARRPDVPMGADADTSEVGLSRAVNAYIAALETRGTAAERLRIARADLDAQRIDGATLTAIRADYLAANHEAATLRSTLNAAWSTLDGVYVAAIDAHENAARLAQAEAARRAAAEREAAARAAAEARRVAASEREAAARAEAEARRVAAAEARRVAAEREAAERARADAEARVAWERARRQRAAAVPTATAQNGHGAVVVRPTRDGKSAEVCPYTGATTGVTYSASVRVAVR